MHNNVAGISLYFQYKEIPATEITEHICFPIVLIGSIYRISENDYP